MKKNTSLITITPADVNNAETTMELYILAFLRNRTEYFGPSYTYKGSIWDLYYYLNGEDGLDFDAFEAAYHNLVETGKINSAAYNKNGIVSLYTSYNLPIDFVEVC